MEVAVNTCVALTRAVLTRLDNCAWIRNTCATLRPHVLQVEQVLNELRATESAKVPLLADALGAIERALSVMDTEISTWESDSKFKGFASANKRKEALQEAARALGDAMGLLPAANVQLTDKVRAGVQRVEGELGNLQVTFDAGVERLEAYERDILANVLSQGEDIGEMKAMLKFLVSTFASPSVDAAQEQRILEKVLTDKKCFKPGHEKEGITIAGNMAAEIRRMKEQEQKQSLAEALENLTIQPDCVKLGHPISHEGGSTVYGGVWDRDGTGTDLRNVAVKVVKVESGQISAEDVARIKKEICCNIFQGLADLHAMGMCHYDMKPANVLLTEHGTAVLTDFQLSREANETLGKTLENEFGTLRYAPPEQMDRDSYDKPGTHSDMWSAAATVCEILSGEKPYHGMDLPGVLGALLTHKQPPKIPASVPAALRPLLQRCFSRDAQNRPTALEALETFVKLSAKDVEEGGTAAGEASETGTMSVGAVQAGRRDASVTTSNGDGRVRTIQVVRKMLADKTRKVVDLDGAVVTVSPAKTIVFAEEEYFSDEEYYDTEVRLVEGKKKLFGGRKMVETRVEVKKTRKIPKTRWSELAAEVPAGTRRTRKVVEFGDGLKLDRPGVTFRNASIEIDVPAADEYRCASPELVVVTAANVELENISVTVRGGGAEAWLTAMAVRMGGSVALSNCEIAVRGETGAAKYCLSVDGGGRASLANCTITCDRACTGLIAGTGSRLDLTQCRVSGADLVAADGGMLQLSDGALSGAQGGAMELRDCTVFAARSGSTSLQVDGPGSVLSVRGGCVEGGQHAMVASGGALLLASACTLKDSISEEAIVTRGGGTRAELTESITYECLLRTDEGPGSEIAIVDETARQKRIWFRG
ncbi:unnamed protein product [Pedinophyceae sp. YPF-701]|nr:unnamed protein product [Pedinophyceae sp. YPF-701]